MVRSGSALAEDRNPGPVQRAGRTRHRAGQAGQAVQERALDRKSLFRLREAVLSSDVALLSKSSVRSVTGVDPHTHHKAQFYTRQFLSAFSPANFVATNPVVLDATLETPRRKSAHRSQESAEGHSARRRTAEPGDGRSRGLQVRRKHRELAGQGRFPERADAAHSVLALDSHGPAPAIADRPALDQQILHPGSQAEELVDQMVRRSGSYRVRDLLGQSGRRARRQGVLRLSARGAARRPRRDRTRDRGIRGQRHRILHRRYAGRQRACLHGGNERQADRLRDAVHDVARLFRSRRHLGLHRRSNSSSSPTSTCTASATSKAATWPRRST